MTKPRRVWIVTSGEYSDYGVCAAFEREEDAHAAQSAGLGDRVQDFAYYPVGAAMPTSAVVWERHTATSTARECRSSGRGAKCAGPATSSGASRTARP